MRHAADRPFRRRTGFTLIELLVVIAVIAILAAMLLPALQGAQARAMASVCLGHARGIGQAIGGYLTTSEDILPPGKYGHQGGHPVPKVWMQLLYEGGYIDDKKGFQCPADDVTNNASRYYDSGPAYPNWWASYAMVPNDLFWATHEPLAANMANHEGYEDKQILLGESESNFITASWLGWGDAASFKKTYMEEFPFDRHSIKCSFVMLDGHGLSLRVPSSTKLKEAEFETDVRSQFRRCTVEGISTYYGGHWEFPHVCFWEPYNVGLGVTPTAWIWQ
jgi:prepilin-type N-terminal cleavage/methylation domain-containing protein